VGALVSLGYLERVIGLEGVLKDKFALNLSLFVFNLILQPVNFFKRADVFGVNLGLKQVEFIDLLLLSTILLSSHLSLGQVNPFQLRSSGILPLSLFCLFFFPTHCLLLVKDFTLLLPLPAVLEVLNGHAFEVLSAEHLDVLVALCGGGLFEVECGALPAARGLLSLLAAGAH
jgi:hypothetical protein